MGVLLERARKVFGGGAQPLAPPEAYDIPCVCGEHVRGYRRDYRQFVSCPNCGQLHLVLPTSVYPKPIAYETPRQLEHIVEVVQPRRPVGVRLQIRMRRTRRAGMRLLWSLIPPARWFSPIRLLIMAMLLVVAGTVWTTVYWNRRGSLTSDIVAMREAWTRDIEAADFARARTKLDRAVVAIRRYGGHERDVREIEQLAAEVAQFADVLDRPLDDVLHERRLMSSSEADRYIEETLKNPALVLDTFVSPSVPSGQATSSYRVDTVIVTGQGPVRVDVSNLKLFALLAPARPTRVVFTARIQAIERIPNSQEWNIRFTPDSGVLVTSGQCLEKLGWPMDEATRTVLETQAQWVLEEQ